MENQSSPHNFPSFHKDENLFKAAIEYSVRDTGLRELLLDEIYQGIAQTLIKNPLIGNSAIKGIKLNCLSLKEAYAEKIRAALTRREPAIRDFFDIYHGVSNKIINPFDNNLLDLVNNK